MEKEKKETGMHEIHRLIEECSEVQKVCCKILRFGADFKNPSTNQPNISELAQECADLVEVMSDVVDIDGRIFKEMREDKREKVDRWKKREIKLRN